MIYEQQGGKESRDVQVQGIFWASSLFEQELMLDVLNDATSTHTATKDTETKAHMVAL